MACDQGGGDAAPAAVTPVNQQCYNGYGYNNGYGYGNNGYLNTCTQAEINQGYKIVNGVQVSCYNPNIGYNGTCYDNGYVNHVCTQAELNQGFWTDAQGIRRTCTNNFLNNGFYTGGSNYDYSQATAICQQAYGPTFYAVVFPGINTIKCVSGFTVSSFYNYYNYYPTNPFYYGGYQNVYQACRVGTTYNGCHCGNIGGTLGWVSAGVSWGICL